MHYKSKMKSYRLTPTRRRLCRSLIRSSLNSFAIQAVKRNASTRAIIVKVVGEMLHKEVACLCSDDLNSIMKQKDVNCYKKFDMIIEKINGEIELVAPILFSLLQSCLKTRRPRTNTRELVAVIVSILCKHRRPEVCLLQKIFSLILYVGHASKQVSIWLPARVINIVVFTS